MHAYPDIYENKPANFLQSSSISRQFIDRKIDEQHAVSACNSSIQTTKHSEVVYFRHEIEVSATNAYFSEYMRACVVCELLNKALLLDLTTLDP